MAMNEELIKLQSEMSEMLKKGKSLTDHEVIALSVRVNEIIVELQKAMMDKK